MISILPEDLLSIVASQVDPKELAKFMISEGHLDLLKDSLMI